MPPARPYDSRQWRALRLRIIARDKGCVVCGSTEQLDVDHIVAWQAGGAWYDPANLRTLCRTHHNRKRTRGTGTGTTTRRRRQPTSKRTPTNPRRATRHVSREW